MPHRILTLSLLFLASYYCTYAQNTVGIGTETPNQNAVLHLVAPDGDQGLLIPQLSTAQRTAGAFTSDLSSDDQGLLVYDADQDVFYYWSGSAWIPISTQDLSGGSGISINGSGQIVNEGDLDETNEIQDLNLSGSTLTITGNPAATDIDLSPFLGTNTDEQTLSLSGANLSISNGNTVDISGVNTDSQTLSFGSGNLSISGGNSVDLSGLVDTDDQTLSYSAGNLSISDGNSVDISGVDTDDQNLSYSAGTLSITDGNSIDISELLDNTDAQNLSYNDVSYSLSIGGGNSVDLSGLAVDNVDDADNSTTNEIQDLSLSGNILSLSGDATTVSLVPYLDNQTASQVNISAITGISATTVQGALAEHQTDINNLNSAIGGSTTDFLNVRASEFAVTFDGANPNVEARIGSNGLAAYLYVADGTASGTLSAPVILPQGATIKTVTAYMGNGRDAGKNCTLDLISMTIGDTEFTENSLGSASLPPDSGLLKSAGFNVDAPVRNDGELYYLVFAGDAGPTVQFASINYVQIEYDY